MRGHQLPVTGGSNLQETFSWYRCRRGEKQNCQAAVPFRQRPSREIQQGSDSQHTQEEVDSYR